MTEASSDPTLPDPALAAEGSAPAGPSAEAVVAPTDPAESLAPHAERLLKLAFLFDVLGSDRSGFHMFLSGLGHDGRPLERRFFLVARSGHGPFIPCMPAILLARRLAAGEAVAPGARPCLDLIDLPTYLAALDGFDITVRR